MSFAIECPNCQQVLLAAEDMAGQYVRCVICDEVLEVPEPLEESPAADVAQSPDAGAQAVETERPPQPAKDRSPNPPPVKANEAPVGFRRESAGVDEEMDLTPMVDVTFLLLIFFMVTATFNLQKSFETPGHTESEPSTQARSIQDFEEDPDFVVVRIDELSTYYVSSPIWEQEQETPSEQELLVKLREARHGAGGERGATRMLVMAHGDALHQRVVTALDAGTASGMEEVKMMTVEDDF